MGFLLGLPVSGITFPVSVDKCAATVLWARLTVRKHGQALPATGVIVAATLYLWLSKRIYTSEEMKALVIALIVPRRSSRKMRK